jgi:hypothetical protein
MNHSSPEVEAKILDVTEKSLLPRLTELGFQKYFEWELKAQWLINPANGQKLRVRQEGDIVMIEHKAPYGVGSSEIKSLKETGFEARGFDTAIETLCLVGLEKVGLPSVKQRISHVRNYEHPTDWARLDFDTYSDLMGKTIPAFLEIESSNQEIVFELARALWFQQSDCRSYGPKDLFKHYYPSEVTT